MSLQLTSGDILKRLLVGSRWVFGPAAVAFLIVSFWRARVTLQAVLLQAEVPPLILTIALWALLHLLTPLLSALVLREIGTAVDYRTALAIHVGRLPARYLPGGIWHTVSRVMDLHRLGVSRSQLSVLVLLENLVPVGTALTVGGLCLWAAGGLRLPLAIAAVLGGVLLLSCIPLLLRHRALLHRCGYAPGAYLKVVAVTAVFWLVAASAFACYWSAFPAARAGIPILQVYGTYLLAWVIGFISVFAPQGIGVFESVAGVLLKGALSFGGVAVLAAGFRVAILAADALAYAILHALRYIRRLRHATEH
ncbi:MAG TPA: hypothetical protein VHF02_01350 [Luteimonas sp.]|nr:hypothetical protein [Luteimonas sp.]